MGKGISKVIVTFFAVSLMIMPTLAPLIQTDAEDLKPQITYISVGDSMVNGYGNPEYYTSADYNSYGFEVKSDVIYPTKIAKYLESQGYEVEYHQLAVSSTRTLDFRSLIYDDYNGDDFTVSRVYKQYMSSSAKVLPEGYTPDMDGFKRYYQDRISEADLITYQFHYDFSSTMDSVFMHLDDPALNRPFETLDPYSYILAKSIMDTTGMNALVVDRAILSGLGADFISKLIESFTIGVAYCITMYCRDFDYNVARILELNPDATIIVVDTTNPINEMSLTAGPLTIPAGELYGMMGGFGNFYAKYLSPYAGCVYHVSLDKSPEKLLDEFTQADLSNLYLTNGSKNDMTIALLDGHNEVVPEELRPYIEKERDWYIPVESYVVYDYYDGDDHDLTEFLKYSLSSHKGDMLKLLGGDGIKAQANATKMKLVNNLDMIHDYDCDIILHEDGGCTISNGTDSVFFDYNEMFLLYLANSMFAAALIHPSPAGHDELASAIIKAIEQHDILNNLPRNISPLFIAMIIAAVAIGASALYQYHIHRKKAES